MQIDRRTVLEGIGAVALTAPSRSASDRSREVLSPYDFGAVGDGNNDDTAALQKSFNAVVGLGKTLDLGHGVYKVTNSIVCRGDLQVKNSGQAIIRAMPGSYTHPGILNIAGTAMQVGKLGENVLKGATAIKTAEISSFVTGDLASIYNSTGGSWSNWRSYYNAGEFVEVAGVSGHLIYLNRPLYDSYAADNVLCYKIYPVSGFLKDIIIESDGYTRDIVYIDYAKYFRIVNSKFRNANNSCIYISRSFGTIVDNADVINTGNGGDDYGIIVSGQSTRITGGNVMGRRHAVTTGGSNRVNDLPCRDLLTAGAILHNDPTSGVWAADFHGVTEASAYIDCTIYGGISLQGKDVRYINNTIHGMPNGVCCYGAEVVGGVLELRGNTFYIGRDPFIEKRGVIDFGGNSKTAISNKTMQDTTIIVTKNVFISSALGSNTSIMMIRNRGTQKKINIEFTYNKINVNDLDQLVYLDLVSGNAASDSVIVENNKCSLRGKLALRTDANYSKLPVFRVESDGWRVSPVVR